MSAYGGWLGVRWGRQEERVELTTKACYHHNQVHTFHLATAAIWHTSYIPHCTSRLLATAKLTVSSELLTNQCAVVPAMADRWHHSVLFLVVSWLSTLFIWWDKCELIWLIRPPSSLGAWYYNTLEHRNNTYDSIEIQSFSELGLDAMCRQ